MATVSIRLKDIVTSHNPRNPAEDLQNAFADNGIESADFISFVHEYALSPDEEKRQIFCYMVEEYENGPMGILDLAISRLKNPLQPINLRVFPSKPDDSDIAVDRYGIMAGERRYMAAAYNFAKHGLDAEIEAKVQELTVKEAFDLAIAENLQRKNPTELEYARMFDAYKKEINETTGKNYTLREVAEKLGLDYQFVRGRHGLNFLSDAEKKRLAAGEIGLTKAIAKGLQNKKGKPANEIEDKKANRRRVLTLKETEALFDSSREKSEDYLQALSDVMSIKLAKAKAESDKRLAA
jgi:ParB-like chromosome segregation protein Spo0J